MRFIFSIIFLISLISAVYCVVDCDATYACSDNNTCCRLNTGGWGCCPYVNAVCCSTINRCCPSGSYCTNSGCGSRILLELMKKYKGF